MSVELPGAGGVGGPHPTGDRVHGGVFDYVLNQLTGNMTRKMVHRGLNQSAQVKNSQGLLHLMTELQQELEDLFQNPDGPAAKKIIELVKKLEAYPAASAGDLPPGIRSKTVDELKSRISQFLKALSNFPGVGKGGLTVAKLQAGMKEVIKDSGGKAWTEFWTDTLGQMQQDTSAYSSVIQVQMDMLNFTLNNVQTLMSAAAKVGDKSYQTIMSIVQNAGR